MKLAINHKRAAVTICASNFFGKALVLSESYCKCHPTSDFYILIVDKKHDRFDQCSSNAQVVWVEELGIKDFLRCAVKFDLIELNTNVKPSILRELAARYEQVIYLDPDICVYSELSAVFEALKESAIVVTPHALTPIMDGKSPSDVDFLRFGAFNLGFVGVNNSEEALRFLEWWSERCLEHGYYEPQLGLAVDQKWLDLAPCFFPGLRVLREPGLNVAFWNLHERRISKKDDKWVINEQFPLLFFHYSSFVLAEPHAIAFKQSRFVIDSRPDLHELLDEYAERLKDADEKVDCPDIYSFDYFENGMYMSPTLRRVYAALEGNFSGEWNPFAEGSLLQRFAIAEGLTERSSSVGARRTTFKEIGKYPAATRICSVILRLVLRIIGPNRYFLLMKYMAHISSIRNQGALFQGVRRYREANQQSGVDA